MRYSRSCAECKQAKTGAKLEQTWCFLTIVGHSTTNTHPLSYPVCSQVCHNGLLGPVSSTYRTKVGNTSRTGLQSTLKQIESPINLNIFVDCGRKSRPCKEKRYIRWQGSNYTIQWKCMKGRCPQNQEDISLWGITMGRQCRNSSAEKFNSISPQCFACA